MEGSKPAFHLRGETMEMKIKSDYTLMVYQEGELIYTSKEDGIKALYRIVNEQVDILNEAEVFDTVVGKAAAMLHTHGKIRSIQTPLISEPALEVFAKAGINVEYEKSVPFIQNRTQTGLCPMENLAKDCETPEELFVKLDGFFKR